MRGALRTRRILLLVVALAALGLPTAAHGASLPLVHAVGSHLEAGGKPFIAFGFTYGFASRQPITSYLDDPTPERLARIDRQMAQAHQLGANTLRVRIEPRQILTSPTSVDRSTLQVLRNLLSVAERNRIRLDITGLFAAHLDQVPAWYDNLDTESRWRAQARYWRAVARTASSSPAVLQYELATEPIVPTQRVSTWYLTDPAIHYPMPQYLVRDPKGRDPAAIAREWVRRMTHAVRLEDPRHLISVGMLPYSSGTAFSASRWIALSPANVADLLDTVTPHIYPRKDAVESAVATAKRFAATGKPAILGETFALHSGTETVRDFLVRARPYLDGYLSFYDGRNVDQAIADGDALSLIYANSLAGFLGVRPQLCLYRCQVQP